MNTISESASQWRPNTELAVSSPVMQNDNIPKVGDGKEDDGFKIFGDDGFTFLDFIDVINPLQHIPIIGTLYREMTDDTLDPGSRVIGGTLFLGPVGTVTALANVLVDDATGKDMGEHVMAFFEDTALDQPQVSGAGTEPVAVATSRTSTTVSSNSSYDTPPVSRNGAGAIESIDPVTAWAMAENSYRQLVAGNAPVSDISSNWKPKIQRSNLSVSQSGTVAEWARAEASYRKAATKASPARLQGEKTQTAQAPGWKGASPYAAISSPAPAARAVALRAPAQAPTGNINALSDLRKDLLAGAKPAMARASSTMREARPRTASIAAASYARQQPVPAKQAQPAAGAIGSKGGWFSDTMLWALGKYSDSDTLARQAVAVPTR